MADEVYVTSLLIKAQHPPTTFEEVLERIFASNEKAAASAFALLNKIKKGNYTDSAWVDFIEEVQITQAQYHLIIRKLRGAGLISKVDGVWILQEDFSEYMKECSKRFDTWRKQG